MKRIGKPLAALLKEKAVQVEEHGLVLEQRQIVDAYIVLVATAKEFPGISAPACVEKILITVPILGVVRPDLAHLRRLTREHWTTLFKALLKSAAMGRAKRITIKGNTVEVEE